jgi:hypothetical protein
VASEPENCEERFLAISDGDVPPRTESVDPHDKSRRIVVPFGKRKRLKSVNFDTTSQVHVKLVEQ